MDGFCAGGGEGAADQDFAVMDLLSNILRLCSVGESQNSNFLLDQMRHRLYGNFWLFENL